LVCDKSGRAQQVTIGRQSNVNKVGRKFHTLRLPTAPSASQQKELSALKGIDSDSRDNHDHKVKNMDIFMEVLFAHKEITYKEDKEEIVVESIDKFCENEPNLDKEGFITAVKSCLHTISRMSTWKCACAQIVMMCTILSTLVCFPQAPHTDYPPSNTTTSNKMKSFIFAISSMGAYLLCWPKHQPTDPIILFIPYGYGLLFGPELIHAGGLGFGDETEKVLEDPMIGCPRAHLYVVSDIKDLPLNFICYAKPGKEMKTYNSEYSSVSGSACMKTMNEMKEVRVAAANLADISHKKIDITSKERLPKPAKKLKSKARSGMMGDFSMPQENIDFKHQRYKKHKIVNKR